MLITVNGYKYRILGRYTEEPDIRYKVGGPQHETRTIAGRFIPRDAYIDLKDNKEFNVVKPVIKGATAQTCNQCGSVVMVQLVATCLQCGVLEDNSENYGDDWKLRGLGPPMVVECEACQ